MPAVTSARVSVMRIVHINNADIMTGGGNVCPNADFAHMLSPQPAISGSADVPVPIPSNSGARLAMRITLCARANSSATPLTLLSPRTGSRIKPRLRAWALTHSAVAMRLRQSATASLSPALGACGSASLSLGLGTGAYTVVWLRYRFNLVVARIATIDQPFFGCLSATLGDLFHHR